MSRVNEMSLKSLFGVLPRREVRKVYAFALARVLANLLDILGLAGIALLATSFGAFAAGGSAGAPINLPGLGSFVITEFHAVVISLVIAATFVLKSGFSIWVNLRTSLFVATIEAEFSKKLAGDYFMGGSEGESGFGDSLSEFQNMASYSTSALSTFINARISMIAEASLLLAMVVAFFVINPIATVAMFFYLSGVLFALSRLVTKRIKRNGVIQLEGSEAALQSSRDLFGIRREARASGVSALWIQRFSDGRAMWSRSNAVIYTLSGLPRYVIETSLILGIFAFLAGIVVFSDLPSQAVTIGVFMAGGLRLVASLLPLQSAINSMIDGANRGKPALDRLRVISARSKSHQDVELMVEHGKPLGLHLDDITFGFAKATPVIQDISFEVKAGTKVAIVGPSGAGKTTCFEIATGFRLADSGKASIEGNDPRELLEHGRGLIGIVPQRPHLVSGTLADNVSLSSSDLTDLDKVAQVLKMAGLNAYANPGALEMNVEPDAGQLSGGEIQRLGIARALYRDPGILFLDEATSALDADTEAQISNVLDSLRGKMTVVLIAHRLSTVMNSDKIIYLDKGRVVAEGTFSELQAKVPDFAKAVELMGMSKGQ
jgi:ABC-type multidrug transport system fused ATPase/permease subunit